MVETLALLWQIYSRCFSLQIHFLQRGHRCGGGRAMSSRMAWRTAGNVGRGGGPLILFFPPCFLLSRHPVFANQPSLVAGQMLLTLVPDPLRRSVGNPHADRSKTSLELSFRAGAPTDGAPFGVGQHVFGRYR